MMTEERILDLLSHLPEGVSEVYFHPATRRWQGQEPAVVGYQYEQKLAALTTTAVAAALRQSGIESVNFGAFGAGEDL